MASHIIKENKLRYAITSVNHGAFFNIGRDANVKASNGLNLPERSETLDQLVAIFLRCWILKPEKYVMSEQFFIH